MDNGYSISKDYPGYGDSHAQHERDSQYTHLIAVPGRVAQAREITQLQSTVKDIIKSVGDSFMKDGDVIEGCQVTVSKTNPHQVIITPGKVYINGMVLPVKGSGVNGETIVDIDRVGTETIGFRLKETLITETTDSNLKDPALGFDNMNQPGCYRVKSEIEIIKNGNNSSVLATLIDGEISSEKIAPTYSLMQDTLARRTEDESGSYIVEGMQVRTESGKDSEHYNVVVEAGKAYIEGYEIPISSPRRISVERPTAVESVEGYTEFESGVLEYDISIDYPYVKSIDQVTGFVRRILEFSSAKAGDIVSYPRPEEYIPSESNTILRVFTKNGASGAETLYNRGSDYIVLSGSSSGQTDNILRIQWLTTPESQYYIEYEYKVVFEEGRDYEVYMKLNDNQRLVQGIKWLLEQEPESGVYPPSYTKPWNPLAGRNFTTNYTRYLARKDTVCIDKNGEITVLLGDTAREGMEVAPEASTNTLTLAYITIPPNGGSNGDEYESIIEDSIESNVKSSLSSRLKISSTNVGLTRFTMRDIYNMLNRIKKVEYDQSILSLNDEAKSIGSSISDMKGIFTDPLLDYSRVHYGFNGKLEGNSFTHGVVIDVVDNVCYLPVNSTIKDAEYDEEKSTVNRYKRTVSLQKKGSRPILSQLYATDGFLVNPYTLFPQSPEISLDPAVDNWNDERVIEVAEYQTQGSEIALEVTGDHIERTNTRGARRPSVTTPSYRTEQIGLRTDNTIDNGIIDTIVGNAITYIRPRTITVEGHKFPKEAKYIRGYFDGILVKLTSLDTSLQQKDVNGNVVDDAIMSDRSGNFRATFTIPEKVQTGIREFRVDIDKEAIIADLGQEEGNKELQKYDGYITSSSALYQTIGYRELTIYRSVTVLQTVLLKRITDTVTTHYVDPVGQTFVLNKNTLISGVKIYFKNKPEGVDTPVTCEIREVSNSNITSVSYGSSTKSPDQVTIDAVRAQAATTFEFDDPVYLESNKEYAIVVRSVSPSYEIWVAELGKPDVGTSAPVVTNPYLVGVMMSSSNNTSWTVHQTKDIKFELIEDVYEDSSEVIFKDIGVGAIDSDGNYEEYFSRILLSADAIIPTGTSINWKYTLQDTKDTSKNSEELPIYVGEREHAKNLYNMISLKAELSRDNTVAIDDSVTPVLALDTVGASLSRYYSEGFYVTKSIEDLDAYSNVDVVLDTYIPEGTSIEVYVSTGDSGDWTLASPNGDPSRQPKNLGYDWYERYYTASVAGDPTTCRIMVKLKTERVYSTPVFGRVRVIMS